MTIDPRDREASDYFAAYARENGFDVSATYCEKRVAREPFIAFGLKSNGLHKAWAASVASLAEMEPSLMAFAKDSVLAWCKSIPDAGVNGHS